MRWEHEIGTKWAAAIALGALLWTAAAGCKPAPPAPAGDEGCATVRELGKRGLERWRDLDAKAPPPDASLSEAAAHSEKLAKGAREIVASFAKPPAGRADLAESAEGVRMLGDLAAQKLDALAATVRAFDARVGPLTGLESKANDAVDAMGKDVAKNLGCDGGKPPECAAVTARLAELDHVRAPAGLAGAATLAEGRADTLDALAKAIEALPAAPPKQKAREDIAKHAREAAVAFRALSQGLAAASPIQQRLPKDRQDAEEAAVRLMGELTAASEVCLPPKPATSASAAPAAK